MPGTTHHTKGRKAARPAQRTSPVPSAAETIPRFAPSPADRGSAFAARILEGFRKELEGIDLKAASSSKQARRKRS